MSDRRLAARLRTEGHDPVLAVEVGLLSATDARVLGWAIARAPFSPFWVAPVAPG